MSSFFDYEKLNNIIIKTMKTPAMDPTVNAIIDMKATILVPHSASLTGLEITKTLVMTHIAITNPTKKEEILTINGLVCVVKSKEDNKFLHRLSERQSVKGVREPTLFFQTKRQFYDEFYNSNQNIIQSIQILREGEILLKKKLVPIILIAEPLCFESCSWWSKKDPEPPKIKTVLRNTIPDQSMKPTSYRDLFYTKLKDAKATDISSSILNFVDSFLKQHTQMSMADQGQSVHQFIVQTVEIIQSNPLWKGAPPEELEEAYECLEKFIMLKLYKCCFANSPEQVERDQQVTQILLKVQWLTLNHLEVRFQHQNERKFKMAISELRNMDTYKAPKDKMTCILNSCKALYSILNKASQEGHPAGADEFLPLLIYAVVKANPPRFQSNIDYIQNFRKPNKLITESGYYLTHLASTVAFVENLEPSVINIDPLEFHRLMNNNPPDEPSNGKNHISDTTQTEPENPKQTEIQTTPSSQTNNNNQNPQNNEGLSDSIPQEIILPNYLSENISQEKTSEDKNLSLGIPFLNPPLTKPHLLKRSSTPMLITPPSIDQESRSSQSQFFSDSEYGTDSLDSLLPGGDETRERDDFCQVYETDGEMEHFLSLANAKDLRIGDVPRLLALFREIATENVKLKDELEKYKIAERERTKSK